MKALAPFLLLCLFALPVVAQEPSKGCAPVYGTWRTAYVMDKFGNPQPLEPASGRPGLIMEARIDEKSAVLVWHGGEEGIFLRGGRYAQNEYKFNGLGQDREYVAASTNHNAAIEYPSDECYLRLWYSTQAGDLGSLKQLSLMKKIK